MLDPEKGLTEVMLPEPAAVPEAPLTLTSVSGSEVVGVSVECSPDPPFWWEDFFTWQTRERLVRFGRLLGASDLAEAETAADDVLRAMRRITTPISEPEGYAWTAVRNWLIRQGRREKQRRSREEKYVRENPSSDGTGSYREIEGADWVRSVLSTLGDRQHLTMRMYLAGSKPKEIAEELGIPLTNVTSNLKLARSRLLDHEEIKHLHRRVTPYPPDSGPDPGETPDVAADAQATQSQSSRKEQSR